MRILTPLILLLVSCAAQGQDVVNWDGAYQLQLSDFQSAGTRIGDVDVFSLNSSCTFDFSFYMSNAEFMFTKNFNSKVNSYFKRSLAVLVAPDTALALDLLAFARFEFDLTELYARRFRKRLYEDKGAFSNVTFFQPIYEKIHNEMAERHTMAASQSDVGRNQEKLNELHAEVLREIAELAEFCKTCKPAKKKKTG